MGAIQWARRSLGCLFRYCRGSLGVESMNLSWWLNVEGLCSNIPDSSSDPISSSSSSESLLELDLEPLLWSDTGILFGSFRWTCCWKRYKSVTMCDWHDAKFRNIYNEAIIYEKRNNSKSFPIESKPRFPWNEFCQKWRSHWVQTKHSIDYACVGQ